MSKPLAVCIAGPTACGKTAAAVAVCRALSGEVISMDSMQIYRGMDIGTAKPDAAERGGIAHHMLDFLPPTAAYSAYQYQQDASRVMEDILSRGKLPVFAGGTGLYLQSVKHPLRFAMAQGNEALRQALNEQAQTPQGRQALWQRLCRLDPQSAAGLHPNDVRRVVRALEVLEATGESIRAGEEWEAPARQDFLTFGLRWPRETLRGRINARVDEMMRRGLVKEVRSLLEGGVPRQAQAMQAIGYKEICRALAGECTMDEAVEQIKIHSRQYAKRQMTWLARDGQIRWLDADTFETPQALHGEIILQIQKYREDQENGL
ncbi:MAG TPA: tRNA (adenosine(37)-N6)-dimethylallyltransferase MiaA [Candidatus Aphodomonas merdavium]|nr:tRNA (adenosine(37)-N6)-dimethylallyltransferase MiaA [Candidatus Aphodomonas merdavium]